MTEAKIRLYVDCPLSAGQGVALSDGQANYLFAVMRLPLGAGVLLFNGQDGEWLATVAEAVVPSGRVTVAVGLPPPRSASAPAENTDLP